MKHRVMLYAETFTEIEVEADDLETAKEKALTGEYSDDDIIDVTVKESEIID